MIEITQYKYRVTITGHAGYAEHGHDIVCAGVSTLVQTLIQSLQKLTMAEIKYDMQPGKVDIIHGLLLADARTLMDAFFIGVNMIAEEYPQHVRVVQAMTT